MLVLFYHGVSKHARTTIFKTTLIQRWTSSLSSLTERLSMIMCWNASLIQPALGCISCQLCAG